MAVGAGAALSGFALGAGTAALGNGLSGSGSVAEIARGPAAITASERSATRVAGQRSEEKDTAEVR